MAISDLTIALVGSGGDGVITMGEMLAQAGAREGLHVIKTEAYGPQIRGGESSCTVRLSANPIFAQGDNVDVLVVLSWPDYARFKGEIATAANAVIFYEEADEVEPEIRNSTMLRTVAVPFTQLAKDTAGVPAAKNIVTLGILSELFALPQDGIRKAIEAKFSKKKAAVLESNMRGFEGGIAHARSMDQKFISSIQNLRFAYKPGEKKLLMSGNEAVALGALHAGCKFFAGYPITPSSEVLHMLGEWLPKVGGSVLQTEDELSAIGAVIGGSFAGVKSMTATSGPGLSLMSELLGLSAMAEVPSVIVDVQRGGPSTGLPTKSEQSDLWHALYGGHGDTPRVVLATSDVEDCFHTTVDAFNIAEEYQVPVIVLSDQVIGQRRETLSIDSLKHEVKERRTPTEDELVSYNRYRDTADGVSPISSPGMKGGMYQTNGLEHDEHGSPTAMYLTHEKMNEKRFRKLWPIRHQYHFVRRYGAEDADVGILCWGSSKGPVKEAVLKAAARGEKVAAIVPQVLFPFPKREFEDFLAHVQELLILELSYSAQFYKYLRTFLDFDPKTTHVFKRSGGKGLTVGEVEEQIQKILDAKFVRTEVLV